MRLGPMTVIMFIIYLGIGIFSQTLDTGLNTMGNANQDFLFNTIMQPQNWSGMFTIPLTGIQVPMFLAVLGSAITIAVGISMGTSLISRSDISVLFSLFLAFVSLGALPCIDLYMFVTRNVNMFACSVGEPCFVANLFGALTAGILAIMWLFTCLEWWAWRATTQ